MISIWLLLFSQVTYAAFSDVTNDTPFNIAIDYLERNKVVEGYQDGTFRPNQEINRVEFLKMIYATIGYNESASELVDLPFPDVADDEWYTIYVQEAYRNYVIDGYPDGTFQPENSINNVEALKIVMNAFFDVDELHADGDYEPCYDDLTENTNIDEDQWYWKYMSVADSLCIIPEEMADGLRPANELQRGQMAEFIYRAKTVQDWAEGSEYTPYSTQLAPSDLE